MNTVSDRHRSRPVAAPNVPRILRSLVLALPVVFAVLPLLAVAKPSARREDVPLIRCQVCEHIARNILRQVQALRRRAAPKKLSELEILGVAERICDLKRAEGDWIQWIDVVESRGDVLQLEVQPHPGDCRTECKTIEKACQEVMGSADTDVAEMLYARPDMTPQQLVSALCVDHAAACTGSLPRAPKDRKPGEAFRRKSETEVERERMMRNLESRQEMFAEENPGAPRMPKMKLYSRDDLMKRTMMGKPEDEEDEEEDDEEDDGEGQGVSGPGDDGLSAADPTLRRIAEAMRGAESSSKRSAGGAASRAPGHASPTAQHGGLRRLWARARHWVQGLLLRLPGGAQQGGDKAARGAKTEL